MTCWLAVHASYSLPKWQAVKLTFFASCIKSKVLKILTCIRQENANEQYCDTIKDLLLPNTITGQKDEKPHTARLDDTKILLQKSSIPQYHKPHVPLSEGWGHGCIVEKRYTVGGLKRGKQEVLPSLTFTLFELDPLICL